MKRWLAWLIWSCVLFVAPARAETICVNETGSGNCEESIQDGVDAAAAGDTVSVSNGTYFESVTIPAGKDGLTLRGSGDNTILDPENQPAADGITVQSDNVTIQKLKIRNGQSDGVFVGAGASGTVIEKVTITGPAADCINGDGPGTQVLNSELLGCGDQAIDIDADDATVDKVTMENADSGCLDISGERPVVRNSTCTVSEDADCFNVDGDDAEIVNNRANTCDGDGFDITGDDWLVERNRANNAGHGFTLACDSCSSARAANNRAEDVADDTSGLEYSGDGATIESNRAENVSDQGFEVVGDDNTVRRNQVERAGGDQGEECIRISGDDNTVENNVARTCHGNGLEVSGDGNLITDNRVRDARESGFEVTSGSGNVLEDNRADDVNYFAFEVDAGVMNTELIDDRAGGSNRADLCDDGTGTDNQSPQLENIAKNPCELPDF